MLAEVNPVPVWRRMKEGRVTPELLLRRMAVVRPPIDVEALAARLDIAVHRIADPGWSGACRTNNERAEIWLAKDEASVRQRFTIAHEIGHIFLHPLGEEFRDTTFVGDPREADANQFAADLLMPVAMVQAFAPILSFDAGKLAALFGVSRRAMEIRLLKLIEL